MSDRVFRILLAEDSSADVYLFRKALEEAALNFELLVVQDGAEAVAFCRGEGKYAGRAVPDLVALDLNLPKTEGPTVLEALRRCDGFANVPVVITSSLASPSDRVKVEQFQVERYITKPSDLDSFMQIGVILKEVLLKHELRSSAASSEAM